MLPCRAFSATAAFPDSSQPVVRLALFYSNQKRYEESIGVLETRLKRQPDDRGALYQLGRAGAVSGSHLDRAQAALNRFLKLPHRRGTPSIAAAHWRLGVVLEAKGDKKTARAEYETAPPANGFVLVWAVCVGYERLSLVLNIERE